MVRELFRNVFVYKEDTSIDFNIMKDKSNPCYSLLLIKIFNNMLKKEIYLCDKNLWVINKTNYLN